MVLRSDTGHGYARLTPLSASVVLPPSAGGVLFVDMDVGYSGFDDTIAALRSLHPSVIGEAGTLIFRSPLVRRRDADGLVVEAGPGWPSDVSTLRDSLEEGLRQHGLRPQTVAAVEFPVGRDRLTSGFDDERQESLLLSRCRAVELEAYLLTNEAIWRPTKYHYRLPSGHHAANFVRVADALRSPRAPAALAFWLHGLLTDSTAIVVDSGTLMPVVQQLGLIARLHEDQVLHVEAVDAYPTSRFEFLSRFGRLEAVDVLALLSVSSTGRTYEMLKRALTDTAGGDWRAECLVSRGGPFERAEALPPVDEKGPQSPWLVLEDLDAPMGPDEQCRLCRQPETAQLIHIDPRTFAAMALPLPTRIMPAIDDARRNASLFEAYQTHVDGTPIQVAGTEWSRTRHNPYLRSEGRQRVRFEPTALARDPEAAASLAAERIEELENLPRRDAARGEIQRALGAVRSSGATLAVCDPEELRLLGDSGSDTLLALVRSMCPDVEAVVAGSSPEAVAEAAGGSHESVALVAIGLQTSVTLQHLVVTVQDAFREMGSAPTMCGLVVHAHPTDSGAWRSVRNSFRGEDGIPRLLSLWLTYMPRQSPLALEFRLLETVQDEWFDFAADPTTARALWQARLAYTDPTESETDGPGVPSPLWTPVPRELRRTSRYGDLDDRHTLVAVGTAMQHALQNAQSAGAPEWIQFDLPNVLRSYFDGLLHASVLRWLTPDRAWWGPSENDCPALLAELAERDERDWKLLLPEALLAGAEGKIPHAGVLYLLDEADRQLASGSWEEEVLAFVDLGRVLASEFLGT